MKPLTIELKPGERQSFTFVGWQKDRVAFFARNDEDNPKVVELSPAYPHNLDNRQPFAFPMVEPSQIFPMRLVPPVCVASKDDVNEFAQRLFRETVLYPQRKHEQALRRALKWCHAKATRAQASEITTLKNASSLELFPFDAAHAALGTPKSPRRPEAIEAERHRQIKKVEDNYRPRLVLTLEGLKRGEDDYAQMLRNHVLVSSWAEETGTDLKKMKLTAQEFASQWYRAWGSEYQPSPDDMPDDRAAVRFGIRFAQGATFYLRGVRIRNLLTTAEVEDFEKLESAQKPPEIQSPATTKWHSEDFREIYLHDRVGRLKDTALPHNSLRALCLLLAGHAGKPMPFTEIEPKIGALACELDKSDKVKKPSNIGSHQIRDLVNRTTTGKKLKRWGVLTLNGSRERFVKLAPPVVK